MSRVRLISFALLLPLALVAACRRDKTAPQGIVPVTMSPVAGSIVKKVPPVYPPIAKVAGVQGTVLLHEIVAEDGTVESLDVISGPPLLRSAAVDAVKQWVYKPYLLNGVPRRVDTKVTVNFVLAHPAAK